MKRRLVFLLTCGFAAAATAQQYPEMAAGMKAADMATKALNKMEKKAGPQAVRAAEMLGSIYENLIPFWRARNATDAVKWSEEGKAAALELATAIGSGNAEKTEAALKVLGANCRSCHTAHRENLGEGKYRIK